MGPGPMPLLEDSPPLLEDSRDMPRSGAFWMCAGIGERLVPRLAIVAPEAADPPSRAFSGA